MRPPANSLRVLARSALLLALLISGLSAHAQQSSETKRRILSQTPPAYPALARHLRLQGVVKVDALIAADGTVKAMDVKGGHPVLADAATRAIRNWKWETGPHESHEMLEIRFLPPD